MGIKRSVTQFLLKDINIYLDITRVDLVMKALWLSIDSSGVFKKTVLGTDIG